MANWFDYQNHQNRMRNLMHEVEQQRLANEAAKTQQTYHKRSGETQQNTQGIAPLRRPAGRLL